MSTLGSISHCRLEKVISPSSLWSAAIQRTTFGCSTCGGSKPPRRRASTLLDIVREFKPIVVAQESGQIRSAMGPWLRKRMDERKIWVATETFPTKGDKSARALSLRGRMAVHGLRVPATAPWLADLYAELVAFPAGPHDDIADSLALCGQLLDRMAPGRVPAERPRHPTIRSVQPSSRSRATNSVRQERKLASFSGGTWSTPTRRVGAPCCARTVKGHAAAAPLSANISCRRLMAIAILTPSTTRDHARRNVRNYITPQRAGL